MLLRCYVRSLLLAATLFLMSLTVSAEPASSLWLSYSQDEEGAKSTGLSLQLGLSEDDTLQIGGGWSDSDSFNDERLLTHRYLLGYNTLRLAPVALNVFYEYWGKADELVIHTGGLGVLYMAEDYTAGLNLEYRDITLYTRTFNVGQQQASIDSPGIGPDVELYAGNWQWRVHGMWYDYSEDITQLNTLRAIFLIGIKTYDRASALNNWLAGTTLRYRFEHYTVGISYLSSQSALDRME